MGSETPNPAFAQGYGGQAIQRPFVSFVSFCKKFLRGRVKALKGWRAEKPRIALISRMGSETPNPAFAQGYGGQAVQRPFVSFVAFCFAASERDPKSQAPGKFKAR
jgi:hypothetical protein